MEHILDNEIHDDFEEITDELEFYICYKNVLRDIVNNRKTMYDNSVKIEKDKPINFLSLWLKRYENGR
jgi:hypothetical protein